MSVSRWMSAVLLLSVAEQAAGAQPTAGASAGASWDSVASILQTTTTATDGYRRYNLPRRDVTLRVGNLTVSPSLGLGTWAGFGGTPQDATMMGDLVVLSSELKRVLAELSRQGIDVAAIHNHLAGEEPSIRNVHFHGQGRATELATRLDRVIALTATPRPVASAAPRPSTFDTAMVFGALGTSGRAQGDIAQVSYTLVSRAIMAHGHPVLPAFSTRSPVNIQMIDSTRAVATGDFAVLGAQVDAVLDALAGNGITTTAVHSHLVGEEPTLYYIHFWADGRPAEVLRGLRAAADAGRSR
jgi:hypothetical protein